MKYGVMNYPARPLVKEIEWAGQNGFDFIDLTIEPPFAFDVDHNLTKKTLDKFNLEVVGHTNPTLPIIYPVESISRASLEELVREIDLLVNLWAKKINIHPFTYSAHLDDDQKFHQNLKVFKQAQKVAKELGVDLMLENFISPYDQVQIFEMIFNELPGLKLHLDIGHCNLGNNNEGAELAQQFFIKFSDKIIHLHIHDNRGVLDEHLPLGCGNIDWNQIARTLKEYRYNNTITFEVFAPERSYLLMSRDFLLGLLK